jgi:hypothetical protein
MTAATFAEATGRDEAARELHGGSRPGDHPRARHRGGQPLTPEWVFAVLAAADAPEHTRFDRYLPWAAREFGRLHARFGSDWVVFEMSRRGVPAEKVISQFRAIVDWAEAENVDLNRYGLDDAIRAAEQWSLTRERPTTMVEGTVVYSFPDGWTVQELNEQDALDAEAQAMQHCLNTYESDRGMEQGRVFEYDPPVVLDTSGMPVRIFSLRDPKGLPHVTMEFVEDRNWHPGAPFVQQLRGKQNAEPREDYLARMVEFRRDYLADTPAVSVEFPDHADGIGQPLVGAFKIVGGLGDDTYLIYADGTVLDAVDFEESVATIKAEGETHGYLRADFPTDSIALNEYMISALDRIEPKDLGTPLDDVDWIYWAAWLAHDGRARIAGSTDEMVRWLARPRPRR